MQTSALDDAVLAWFRRLSAVEKPPQSVVAYTTAPLVLPRPGPFPLAVVPQLGCTSDTGKAIAPVGVERMTRPKPGLPDMRTMGSSCSPSIQRAN